MPNDYNKDQDDSKRNVSGEEKRDSAPQGDKSVHGSGNAGGSDANRRDNQSDSGKDKDIGKE